MFKTRIVIILLMLLMLHGHIFAQEEGQTLIISPTDGEQLFGLVLITGTVTHPSLFDGYALDWSSAQNPDIWLPIQSRIRQQITDGILGQWDTAALGVPDGTYQIRLQMFLSDGNVQSFIVRNLQLVNSLPTQVPTPPAVVPQETEAPLALPTAGASPTSAIEQPPTVAPRPTLQQVEVPITSDNDNDSELFDFSAAQSAFCFGIYFTLGFFALIIFYLMIRSQLSPYTRRLWWQIRSELDDDQGDN